MRRGVDWDEIFSGYCDGAAGGARALRRRGAPDARHRARLPARGGGRRSSATPRGTATAASSASASAASRREFPPEPYEPAFALARDEGLRLGAARRRGRRPRVGARRARRARRRPDPPRHPRRRGLRRSCASSPSGGIVLDVCPISNLRTRAVASLDEHPLPQLVAAGVPCSISTDDPAMFDTDLTRDYDAARSLGARAARVLRGRRRRRALRRGDEDASRGDRRGLRLASATTATLVPMSNRGRTWHGLTAARRRARRAGSSAGRAPRAEDSRHCRRHDVLPEAARARAVGLRPPRDRLRRRASSSSASAPARPGSATSCRATSAISSAAAAAPRRRSNKDQKRIDKNPKDYAAYKDLAARAGVRRQDRRGDRDARSSSRRVNPKDVDGLTQLAEPLPAARPTTRASAAPGDPGRVVSGSANPSALRAGPDVDARQGVPGLLSDPLVNGDRRPTSNDEVQRRPTRR